MTTNQYETALRGFLAADLRIPAQLTLLHLSRSPGALLADLITSTGATSSYVSVVTKDLAEKGLIAVSRFQSDPPRRGQRLLQFDLTDAGRELLAKLTTGEEGAA